MTLKQSYHSALLFIFVFLFGTYDLARATESITRTTTSRNQTIFSNNSDCGSIGGTCTGNAATGGITIPINGGSLNFNLCQSVMAGASIDNNVDLPCGVTPPMIPPGADTQLGTGLNPIVVNDAGVANVPFGGLTNDPVPSGSSNVIIAGFLVHGAIGEQTLRCTSVPTCGAGVSSMSITHFQSFRSVPFGQVMNPANPGVTCGQTRCNHIEFSINQPMTDGLGAVSPFSNSYVIDSKTDQNGNVVSAVGSWTQNCNGCDGNGTFHLVTPFSPSPTASGFIQIDSSNTFNCPVGSLVDPFHQNNVVCQ